LMPNALHHSFRHGLLRAVIALLGASAWSLAAHAAPGVAVTNPANATSMNAAQTPLPTPLIEAESALGTGRAHGGNARPDRKLTAFGGACLGNGWGRERGDWAEYSVTPPRGAATVHLRYARLAQPVQTTSAVASTANTAAANTPVTSASAAARLRVRIGGIERIVTLPETGDWELWRWLEVPLGEVSKGTGGQSTLRLEAVDGGQPINLDALIVAPSGEVPPQVARRLLFDGSRHLRIQFSPGVRLRETDRLFAVAEASYTFLRDYLGEEPARRLTVHVIAEAERKNDFVGHSSGYAMYLDEEHIFETGHNWVHEMTHCFQRGPGRWPTWLSEGEAWLTYYEAETALFGRDHAQIALPPEYFASRLPRLRDTLIVNGQNTIQQWGEPGFADERVGAAYGFANYMLSELRRLYGPGLMRRYRVLLRAEAKDEADIQDPVARDTVVVQRLGRAAGADLRPLFRSWGFGLKSD
jgi:hypothetical protein